jgi:hypothetical protein
MSNVVQFSITGDTNAEQVAGRAKAAVSGLDKQLEGVGNKFSNSFKDIFLRFLGPMALVTAAISFISKAIEENEKKRSDANQAAIDGTNALMSAEDKYWANKRNNEKKGKADTEEAKIQRETTTQEFLNKDPRGGAIRADFISGKIGDMKYGPAFDKNRKFNAYLDKEVQETVQKLIAEDAKKNPSAGGNLKDTSFTAPSGFSNVIGVGSNPVLENMTRQTDIQQQILDGLKAMSPRSGGINQPDFTKEMPLPIQKAGL